MRFDPSPETLRLRERPKELARHYWLDAEHQKRDNFAEVDDLVDAIIDCARSEAVEVLANIFEGAHRL